MNVDAYHVILLLHILLFGYWLGADLGVFFCDSQMTRDDLDIEERMRVRRIRYKVDMAPRTCLVLILALGFTLARSFGSPIDGAWLLAIWVACLAWLALIWAARIASGTPRGKFLSRLDRKIWWTVGAIMVGIGIYALSGQGLEVPNWLAVKMMLYGLICWNGIWIMRSADHWYPLIEMARRGGDEGKRAEPLMKATRLRCGTSAGVLWLLVLAVAFFGTVKPL